MNNIDINNAIIRYTKYESLEQIEVHTIRNGNVYRKLYFDVIHSVFNITIWMIIQV